MSTRRLATATNRHKRPAESPSHFEAVADLFGVLSEPTRLRILHHLQQGRASVSELIAALDIRQANASKQLGILYQAGLLIREKEANMVHYSIRMPLVFKLCELVCDELHRDASERVALLRRNLGGAGGTPMNAPGGSIIGARK